MKNWPLSLCVLSGFLIPDLLCAQSEAIEDLYQTRRALSEQNLTLFWRIDQMSLPELIVLSSDIDEDIASSAITAMGRRRPTQKRDRTLLYKALAESTKDPRVAPRRKALLSITNLQLNREEEFDEEFLMPAVVDAMGDPDIGVCELAVSMLTFNRDPSIFPEVLVLVSSTSTPLDMRMILAEYSRSFESVRAVPALVSLLEIHDSFYTWYTSILSLTELTGIKPVSENIYGMKWEEFHDRYYNDIHFDSNSGSMTHASAGS